ncbi:MAG: hypothetical protein K8S99_10495 [Planctomycetes bacterium]|nr:hypothetical protein [Planctomycetota bacterium]
MHFSDGRALPRLLIFIVHLGVTLSLGAAMMLHESPEPPLWIELSWEALTFPLGTLIEPARNALADVRFAGLLAAILLLVGNSLIWASVIVWAVGRARASLRDSR